MSPRNPFPPVSRNNRGWLRAVLRSASRGACLSAILLSAGSCSNLPESPSVGIGRSTSLGRATMGRGEDSGVTHAVVHDSADAAAGKIEPLAYRGQSGERSDVSPPITPTRNHGIPPNSTDEDQEGVATPPRPAAQPIAHDAEPRVMLNDAASSSVALPYPCPPGHAACAFPGYAAAPYRSADEYICDGGDRNLPVHYSSFERHGLDTEDTVVEYVDHTGERHMQPTDRVCIYAPRFSSVRSSTQPVSGYAVNKAAGAHDQRRTAGFDTRLVIDVQEQREQIQGFHMRSRAGAFDVAAVDAEFAKDDAVRLHTKLLNVYEDRSFLQEGQFAHADEAMLALGLQAAHDWSRDLNPVIYAHDLNGQEVKAQYSAAEYIGAEDRRTKGDLRIAKLADRQTALPGNVITFTIRFENRGGRELHGVRIVDNLTPRLLYIENSVTADIEGQLNLEENGQGSSVLTFELNEPLPGGAEGTITFQCRVR